MEFVIDTHALTRRYGEAIVAVDSLDLRVRRGEVYGFLGPNGAGKTTTLRMLLGLVRPTSGSATVLGEPPGAPAGLARIGAMVEAPAFYPYLSGRDNLRVLARHAALLKDPELLILDEPTNGLDPAGMAEMREFIRSLALGGRTVLLSSHLMGEIEQMSDRVGVIRDGSLVAEGTVDELRGRTGLRVRAEPLPEAVELVGGLPGVGAITTVDGVIDVAADSAEAAAINRALVEAGIAVSELSPRRASLEDVFLELTR
jgi:ABC-type multidrug transport system ATPase subunit